MIEWFENPQNLIAVAQVFAAVITAAATIALWRVTKVLADETKVLSSMTSRPFVVCVIESSLADATAMDVVLKNTGNATAFDVHVAISPPISRHRKPDDEATETEYRISLIAPGASIPREGVMSTEIYETTFQVRVSWAMSPGGTLRENASYPITARDGFKGGWGVKGSHQIAQELEKIRKTLSK